MIIDLTTSVTNFTSSVRLDNILKREYIFTLHDLIQRSEEGLSLVEGIGRKTLAELNEIVKLCGLFFSEIDMPSPLSDTARWIEIAQ